MVKFYNKLTSDLVRLNNKCDQICEKGSYSLSEFPCLMSHNSSWLFAIVIKIFPAIQACLEDKVSKFQTGTMFTSQVMDSQIHAIEKAIRPLFADPVKNNQ